MVVMVYMVNSKAYTRLAAVGYLAYKLMRRDCTDCGSKMAIKTLLKFQAGERSQVLPLIELFFT
jgi:hypothetical protein